MDTATALNVIRFGRERTLKALEGLDQTKLTAIPAGFKNNLLWNAGHILFYTCQFVYGPSGLPNPLPANYKDLFKGGSSPADWQSAPDGATIIRELSTSFDQIVADHAAGKFTKYEGLKVGPLNLATLPEALLFHAFHEGLHLGTMTSIRKLI